MKRSFAPALLVLSLALSGTALSAWLVARDTRQAVRQEFDAQAAAMRDTIGDVMAGYQQVLRAAAGFVHATPVVTRRSWRTFVTALQLAKTYPGIQGLGYVKVLSREQIAAFEAERRAEGATDYTVHPSGDRELYTAIVYLEPEDWRNNRALGYDMFSEPLRRQAMERARDTGQPALSDKVVLLQEVGQNPQAGTLLYHAIYDSDGVPPTVEERRARLVGFTYGVFRMGDFLSTSLSTLLPGSLQMTSLQLFSGEGASPEGLLFDSRRVSGPGAREARYVQAMTMPVGGAPWHMIVSSTEAFEKAKDWSKPWFVLTGGSFISLLIAAIAGSLNYSRDQAADAQRVLSLEVAERKRAEEEARLANGELIHRVKNTLAIVTAIASQTARNSTSVEQFSTAFRSRLVALSRVHDLLRPDPAFAPELATFIRDMLQPYAANGAVSLAVEGPSVQIPRNEAVLLSLLLNELATNATKYGAWSVPQGKVSVSWQLAPSETGDNLTLTWSERDGPAVSAPSKAGFGTNVMQFAVERGLRGAMSTDFRPDGVAHQVSFPMPRAVAPGAFAP